ncbi:MAG: hypothetical protein GEU86_11200 [Actinophytocola sp.]|nr:hypothetical protein [Actinophytocola sp.]
MPQTQSRRAITAFEIQERLTQLRAKAESEPLAAKDLACAWIRDLGSGPAAAASTRLARVFRAGTAQEIDGTAEVTIIPLLHGQAQPAARGILGHLAPLRAKQFDARNATGANILHPLLGAPLRLLLGGSGHPLGQSTLEFETRIEPSVTDPNLTVLALDHGAVARRGAELTGRVRDEATTIVEGVSLLKGYLKLPGGRWLTLPMYELLRVTD